VDRNRPIPSNKSITAIRATGHIVDPPPSAKASRSTLPVDPRSPLLLGMIVLLIGFGGFLIWAAFATLGEGVPASATVTLDTRRRSLQHLSGGVLKELLVKDGDSVTKGQVLMRLDDSTALATKSASESQLRAVEIQIDHLSRIIDSLVPLVNEGFYPANRLLEVRKDLAEAQAIRAAHSDRLSAARLELDRAIVRSPDDGKVMALQITTIGGVIGPGGRLLDIVPDEEKLVIDAQITPHLIEGVAPGLEAEVLFPALNLRKTPSIKGVVEWVSPDRLVDPTDPAGKAGYFIARVVVSKSEMLKIEGASLRPGMPAEVVIRTGDRTFLEYLLKPLSDRMATSLKER
jgi:protease secretion system membrane fusion protein